MTKMLKCVRDSIKAQVFYKLPAWSNDGTMLGKLRAESINETGDWKIRIGLMTAMCTNYVMRLEMT